MNDDNTFWVCINGLIITAIVLIVLMGLDYSNKKNELILKADSCITAALIESDDYGRLISMCLLETKTKE